MDTFITAMEMGLASENRAEGAQEAPELVVEAWMEHGAIDSMGYWARQEYSKTKQMCVLRSWRNFPFTEASDG
jgi:hypothetical protein